MVSAMILTDLISGKENPYAKVFTPSRFSMEDISQLAGDTGKSLKGLSKSFFGIPKDVKVCSHLGCALEWNTDEHSWDCPCHGSRFDKEGNFFTVTLLWNGIRLYIHFLFSMCREEKQRKLRLEKL